MDKDSQLPDCLGQLEKVFPMTESGLRQTPDDCYYQCPVKTRCLRLALSGKEGAQVEEEVVERGSKAGVINFFERWSRKKQIDRKKKR